MNTPTSSIVPTEIETPNRAPVIEGLPILCMSEENKMSPWSYSGAGDSGNLRLISIEKLLRTNNNSPSIDLYEWLPSRLPWPRDGSVLVDSFNDPPGMPPYAAISHIWKQTEETLRRSRQAERPLFIETGLEVPHEISWLGLIQAATAAKSLFCEYLWLDLLCVDQLSKEDKKLQIANMKRIYSNARAVVVMVGGVSAAQPLDQTSDWINRAWTLQEATLCYETWVLVEWKLAEKIVPQFEKNLEHKDLEGNIKIFRLRQLLNHGPEQVLGEAREHGAVDEATMTDRQFSDVEVIVKCFGIERLFSSALDAVVTAKEVSNNNEAESDGGNSESDQSSHDCLPDSTDPYGEDLSPEKKIPEYFKDFHRPEIQFAAAWRSMWLRTSTKEQDMVFSTAHLLGAQIDADYERSLNDLIYNVVQQVSVPAWLTIGDGIPAIPESGLIPMLPIFTAQSQPSYLIDDEIIPAASLVNGNYYCFYYDIEVKSLGEIGRGHMICARMLDVARVTNLVQVSNKRKFRHSSEIWLSCSGLQMHTICNFQGRMGSLIAIVGNGREWDVDKGSDGYPQPYVYLLDRNENGVWVKTGAGSIKNNLFYELEELERIPWRHLRVGGYQGSDVTSCDCGKNTPLRSLQACKYVNQKESDMALIEACYRGSQMKIRQLLEQGASVNATTNGNESPLSMACARANLGIVDLLIQCGANVETLGTYSISVAVRHGNHLIVEVLVKAGANIHASVDDDGLFPLHHAVKNGDLQSTRLLLEAGADANSSLGEIGDTLSLAAIDDNVEMAQLLIHHGANIHGTQNSPLIEAAFHKALHTIKVLLEEGVDVNERWEKDSMFEYALQAACRFPGTEVPKILLEHGADPNAQGGRFGTALCVAAHYGNLPICELLISHGADVNLEGGHWGTALQAAGPRSYPKNSSRNEKVMLYLIENGADIHVQGGRYGNALQAAAFGGKDQAIRIMIERGVSVAASGGRYGSALQAAVYKGLRMTAKLLIDAGADTNVEPFYVERLSRTLSIYVDKVRRLIDEGSDVNASGGEHGNAINAACCNNFQGLLALLREGLEKPKADSEESNERKSGDDHDHDGEVSQFDGEVISDDEDMSDNGDSAGDDAQKLATITELPPEDHLAVVKLLIKHGARIDKMAGRYGTALQAAAAAGNKDVVDVLLHHGASLVADGGRYWTALQAAARYGHYAVVERLVQAGVSVNRYGGRHMGPLQAACVYGHEAVAKYLISAGAQFKSQGQSWVDGWYQFMMDQHINPLIASAFYGSGLAQPLLDMGVDLNGRDGQGRNAMHIAAGKGDYQLMEILQPFFLVDEKKFHKDRLGRTYLHHAASSGSYASVQLLLSAQADVDCVDSDSWTALHWAARKGTVSVIQQLITAGADRKAGTNLGTTALGLALFHRNLLAASALQDLAPVPSHLDVAILQLTMLDVLGTSFVGRVYHRTCNGCQLDIIGYLYACHRCRDFNLCFRCYERLNQPRRTKYGPAHEVVLDNSSKQWIGVSA